MAKKKQVFSPQKFESAKNAVFNLKPRISMENGKSVRPIPQPKKPTKLKNVKKRSGMGPKHGIMMKNHKSVV